MVGRFWGASCILLFLHATSVAAMEDVGSHADEGSIWIEHHLASLRRIDPAGPAAFTIPGTEIWARDLSDRTIRITPDIRSKALGARLRPFKDLDFSIGTELSRSPDLDRILQSALDWRLSVSQTWKGLTGRLFTTGAINSISANVTQAIGASLGLPLAPVVPWLKARLEVSPSVNFEPVSGNWGAVLTPEFVSERVFSSPESPFQSVISLKMGYGLALHAEPNATARVELRVTRH
jgi:hypothetical protein